MSKLSERLERDPLVFIEISKQDQDLFNDLSNKHKPFGYVFWLIDNKKLSLSQVRAMMENRVLLLLFAFVLMSFPVALLFILHASRWQSIAGDIILGIVSVVWVVLVGMLFKYRQRQAFLEGELRNWSATRIESRVAQIRRQRQYVERVAQFNDRLRALRSVSSSSKRLRQMAAWAQLYQERSILQVLYREAWNKRRMHLVY